MPPLFGLSLHKQNKRFGSSTQHNPHLVHTEEKREKRTARREEAGKAGVANKKA